MLSSDKLKSFATFDTLNEPATWDDHLEDDLTVKSPLHLPDTDPLQTIRPYSAPHPDTEDGKRPAPPRSPNRKPADVSKQRALSPSKLSLPKQLALPARPAVLYREDSVEDFSDLLASDDAGFARKIEALKVCCSSRHEGHTLMDDSRSTVLCHPSCSIHPS